MKTKIAKEPEKPPTKAEIAVSLHISRSTLFHWEVEGCPVLSAWTVWGWAVGMGKRDVPELIEQQESAEEIAEWLKVPVEKIRFWESLGCRLINTHFTWGWAVARGLAYLKD